MNVENFKEADWVILRLLYLLVASDPSIVGTPDVQKSLDYVAKRGHIIKGFDMLKKEHGINNTFNEPSIRLFKDLKINMIHSQLNEDEIHVQDEIHDIGSTPNAISKEIKNIIDRKII